MSQITLKPKKRIIKQTKILYAKTKWHIQVSISTRTNKFIKGT
jgi:hypothetical protein